jgi:hypothetical protein
MTRRLGRSGGVVVTCNRRALIGYWIGLDWNFHYLLAARTGVPEVFDRSPILTAALYLGLTIDMAQPDRGKAKNAGRCRTLM